MISPSASAITIVVINTSVQSAPIVGRTRYRNVFLNTGHGTLGWTMACGSGRVLADLISGRSPEIDARDLGPDRYRESTPP